MKSGLYERPGVSATRKAAARANWFEVPLTKLSKVYRGLRPAARPGGVDASSASAKTGAVPTSDSSSSEFGSISTTMSWLGSPSSVSASEIIGMYRASMRSRTSVLGTRRVRVPSSTSAETSLKVEYQTTSETCSLRSGETFVHSSSVSFTFPPLAFR